jgi:hypothetical protein
MCCVGNMRILVMLKRAVHRATNVLERAKRNLVASGPDLYVVDLSFFAPGIKNA